jgi:hypothetical protein
LLVYGIKDKDNLFIIWSNEISIKIVFGIGNGIFFVFLLVEN